MSNDIALNILKDLMTKLIDKFDEMPRRQEVADDLTTLATGVTQIANTLNTPPRHEELKICMGDVTTEIRGVKSKLEYFSESVKELHAKLNKFILIAGVIVGLFFLVAIFTEVYTTIRTPAQTTETHSTKELVDKLDAIQKRIGELHPEKK